MPLELLCATVPPELSTSTRREVEEVNNWNMSSNTSMELVSLLIF
jgi:hypothetical protein